MLIIIVAVYQLFVQKKLWVPKVDLMQQSTHEPGNLLRSSDSSLKQSVHVKED